MESRSMISKKAWQTRMKKEGNGKRVYLRNINRYIIPGSVWNGAKYGHPAGWYWADEGLRDWEPNITYNEWYRKKQGITLKDIRKYKGTRGPFLTEEQAKKDQFRYWSGTLKGKQIIEQEKKEKHLRELSHTPERAHPLRRRGIEEEGYMVNLDGDTIMYHITPKKNLDKILKRGLVPRPVESSQALDFPIDRAVYLGTTPNQSASWAINEDETGKRMFTEEMVMLAVKPEEGTDIYRDPETFDTVGAWITDSTISPKRIKVIGTVLPGPEKKLTIKSVKFNPERIKGRYRYMTKKKNPGAKWHTERADKLRAIRNKYKGNGPLRKEQWNYTNQRVLENELAATASHHLGMNPRPPAAWFAETKARIKGSYPRASKGRLDRITAGIWWKLPESTRERLIERYDNPTQSNPKNRGLLPILLVGGLVYWIYQSRKQ